MSLIPTPLKENRRETRSAVKLKERYKDNNKRKDSTEEERLSTLLNKTTNLSEAGEANENGKVHQLAKENKLLSERVSVLLGQRDDLIAHSQEQLFINKNREVALIEKINNYEKIINLLQEDKLSLENQIKILTRDLHFPPLSSTTQGREEVRLIKVDQLSEERSSTNTIGNAAPQVQAEGIQQNRVEVNEEIEVIELQPVITPPPLGNVSVFIRNKKSVNIPNNGKENRNSPRNKCTVISDSHGRGIGQYLHDNLKADYELSVLCLPGAPFEHVLQTALKVSENYNTSDNVIILAGANNITESFESIFEHLKENLITLASKVTLSIITIPYRHDKPLLNNNIKKANDELEIVSVQVNAHLISCGYFDRALYTTHGLHLNKRGKIHLSNIIINSLCKGKILSQTPPENTSMLIPVIINSNSSFLEV